MTTSNSQSSRYQGSIMHIEDPGFVRALVLLSKIMAAQLLHEAGHAAGVQAPGRQSLWGFTSLVQFWDREPSSPVERTVATAPIALIAGRHLTNYWQLSLALIGRQYERQFDDAFVIALGATSRRREPRGSCRDHLSP